MPAKRPTEAPPGAHKCKTCRGLGQIAWGHSSGRNPGGEATYCPDCNGTEWVRRNEGRKSVVD